LSRAHLIVLNHIIDSIHFNEVKALVADYTAAPVVGTRMKVEGIYGVSESIEGQRIGIFCGIANPQQFLDTVQSLGGNVVEELHFPDHQTGDRETLKRFAEKCRDQGASMLLCTEKDKVKLPENLETVLPIGWVKMELEVVEGQEEWQNFIVKIKKKIDTRSIEK
jgi:tetraacyldisaccharide 4'-kinase